MNEEVSELEALADELHLQRIVIAAQEIENPKQNNAIKLILERSRQEAAEALDVLTKLDPDNNKQVREAQNIIEVHRLLGRFIFETLNLSEEAREEIAARQEEYLEQFPSYPTEEDLNYE